MASLPDEPSDEARDLYAGFLDRQLARGEGDIEELCRQYPAYADTLRELHAEVARVQVIFDELGEELSAVSEPVSHTRDAAVAVSGAWPQGLLDSLTKQSGRTARYGTGKLIARGGMGEIVRVFDRELRRFVVMKTLSGTPAAGPSHRSSSGLPRFLQEAQVGAQLSHPGVVPVHELGVDAEGRPYFTMPMVKGRTLQEVMELARAGREGWTLTRVLTALVRVADTMTYCHAKGVVHRDLKPSNVMIGKYGETYVVDWGLARVLGQPDPRDLRLPPLETTVIEREGASDTDAPLVTMDGAVVGTPSYMAPEQARGHMDAVGPATDVYALGAMLYQALTGEIPYLPAGEVRSPRTVLAAVLSGPPEPRHRHPDIPPELTAICDRAMARDPAHRYHDMGQLAEDLRAFLEDRVVKAHRTGAMAELRAWYRRNRKAARTLSAAAVAVTATLVLTSVVLKLKNEEVVAALTQVDRFATSIPLAALLGSVDDLWPAREQVVPEMDRWLKEADELVSQRNWYQEHLESLLVAMGGFSGPETERAESEDWRRLRWRHDTTTTILDDLRTLELQAEEVRERRERALSLRQQTITAYEEEWEDAIFRIEEADAYQGTQLVPQVGLVPIGMDPDSLLFEFWHVESGPRPIRDSDGRLARQVDSGIVLVLVPPAADGSLAAFFLAKYELTQGQWRRLAAAEPSHWNASLLGVENSDRYPVNNVSRGRALEVLARYDLGLPDLDRWSHAAPIPEDEVEVGALDWKRMANLADLSFARATAQGQRFESWDDGQGLIAPVGTFAANAYGFHDLYGNVAEWTTSPARGGSDTHAAIAGGSFKSGIPSVLWGGSLRPEEQMGYMGIRPFLSPSTERAP